MLIAKTKHQMIRDDEGDNNDDSSKEMIDDGDNHLISSHYQSSILQILRNIVVGMRCIIIIINLLTGQPITYPKLKLWLSYSIVFIL